MNYDIAIIGSGASAITYLDSLVKLLYKTGKRASIAIFDQKSNIGRGSVYSPDYPWLIMNTPVRDLSASYGVRDDFIQWSAKSGKAINPGQYASRNTFGEYIKSKFEYLTTKDSNFYNVTVIQSKVKDLIPEENGFSLITVDGSTYRSRFTVIAARHNSFSDPYHLAGNENFIINPYPLICKIKTLEENKRILIIGSGLTGVDCAISLQREKNPLRMVMVSRMGRLPEVKGHRLFAHPPRFFLAENIRCRQQVTLRVLLRYVRREFKAHKLDWRDYLFKHSDVSDNLRYFQEQTERAKACPTHFNIILGMMPELAKVWPHVPTETILRFMDKYYSFIQQKHGAMPLLNAEKIAALITKGQLHVKKGIQTIEKSDTGFCVRFSDGGSEFFDYIVSATGQKRKIDPTEENLLYVNLLNRNIIEELSVGGIRVKYPQATPLVDGKEENKNLYLIGHNAEGTHMFTNSFPWIVETGFLAASDVIEKI